LREKRLFERKVREGKGRSEVHLSREEEIDQEGQTTKKPSMKRQPLRSWRESTLVVPANFFFSRCHSMTFYLANFSLLNVIQLNLEISN